MIHFHTLILKSLKQSASNNQNITQKILLKSFWSCCKLPFFIQTLSSIPLGHFFLFGIIANILPFIAYRILPILLSVTNHRANSRKKVIILCFLQKLRIQEVMLSCLLKLEDLMDFFPSSLIARPHIYIGAHVDMRSKFKTGTWASLFPYDTVIRIY